MVWVGSWTFKGTTSHGSKLGATVSAKPWEESVLQILAHAVRPLSAWCELHHQRGSCNEKVHIAGLPV